MPFPVVIVGPLAYDEVRTPSGLRAGLLGGSAAYASIASAKYGPTGLVSVAGLDLADGDLGLLRDAGVDVEGVERRDGPTLRWSGTYAEDFGRSDVRNTDLGVVAGWEPRIPDAYRDARRVLLANTDPRAQLEALVQLAPSIVVLDTMDQWIREAPKLALVIARATVLSLNVRELALMTGIADVARAAAMLLARGPRAVIVKSGAAGASLITPDAIRSVPAYPAAVVDPTGAGDAFAGAFLGRLAALPSADRVALRDAFAHGAAAASIALESFGVDALLRADRSELDRRAAWIDARAR
ncbi:MAG TPA: PfkB family carbohydrate kinase [Candidatus Limnocylindria bacterium]|jgi:sugar/nucleoside kinase (ribokinase family)